MRSGKRQITIALLCLYGVCGASELVVAPPVARAEDVSQVVWQPYWPKAYPIEYGATLVLGLAAIGIGFFVYPQTSGGKTGLLFDEAFRDVLRAESRSGRDAARFVGDMGYRTMALFPLVDVGGGQATSQRVAWRRHSRSRPGSRAWSTTGIGRRT